MSSTSRDFLTGAQTAPDSDAPIAICMAVSLVSPLVLTFAFPKSAFGWLALVALAPLFWLWSKSSWKAALRSGWMAGFVFFLITCFWMTNSLGDYIGAWRVLAGILIAIIEGAGFAVAAVLVSLASRGRFGALAVFAAPSAWLIAESVRTRGSLGVPFGELGLAAAHISWLLPIAAYAGVYGLTAIIALCNSALVGIAAGTPSARIAGLASIAALAVLVIWGDVARARVVVPAPTVRVAIAQGDISQRLKWSPAIFDHTMSVYADLTRSAAADGAKVVVWPETAITSYPFQDPSLMLYLDRLAGANRVALLAGTVDRPSELRLFNSVIAISPAGKLAGRYDKHILVPFAEYLPLDRFLRGLPLFDESSQFVPGPGPSLLAGGGLRFGVLVCYESAFAPYAREVANAGADALVIVTDDAWFGETTGPYQHADMSVVDAVETGRWVVRGADTGISEIVDPKGSVVAHLALDQAGTIAASVGTGVDTPYLHFGALWLIVLAIGTLVAAMWPQQERGAGWRSRRGIA